MFLGHNLPPKEIATAAIARRVRCVCISALFSKPHQLEEMRQALRSNLPPDTLLVTGGGAYAAAPRLQPSGRAGSCVVGYSGEVRCKTRKQAGGIVACDRMTKLLFADWCRAVTSHVDLLNANETNIEPRSRGVVVSA